MEEGPNSGSRLEHHDLELRQAHGCGHPAVIHMVAILLSVSFSYEYAADVTGALSEGKPQPRHCIKSRPKGSHQQIGHTEPVSSQTITDRLPRIHTKQSRDGRYVHRHYLLHRNLVNVFAPADLPPVLFLSHGTTMMLGEDSRVRDYWRKLGQDALKAGVKGVIIMVR